MLAKGVSLSSLELMVIEMRKSERYGVRAGSTPVCTSKVSQNQGVSHITTTFKNLYYHLYIRLLGSPETSCELINVKYPAGNDLQMLRWTTSYLWKMVDCPASSNAMQRQ